MSLMTPRGTSGIVELQAPASPSGQNDVAPQTSEDALQYV